MRQDVLTVIDLSIRWELSFWDALVLSTAQKAEAAILWSEDLNDSQAFGSTVGRNPFRA